ncbi:unnamed protein product, partial [Heterosigma akashiwo]
VGEEGSSDGAGAAVGVLLDATSFYAEAGGQVADTGVITLTNADGTVAGVVDVEDAQAYAGYVLHVGTLREGAVAKGARATLEVDYGRRRRVAPNHTMTHVLNHALLQVLGEGWTRRGRW